jgi:hypothetical protein
MPKFQFKDLTSRTAAFFKQKVLPRLSHLPDYLVLFVSSWWHVILIAFAALVFLYYPIGGLMVSSIDTNTSYEIKEPETNQSATVDMMAFIINREVNEKMWTPNLPFFFPSYFLDNMPAFQLGMFDTLAKFSSGFAERTGNLVMADDLPHHLQEAAVLLKYPGTVWMFSPTNRLLPAPSANTQYRKARKHLIKFNAALADGSEVWYKNPEDLTLLLNRARSDLWKNATRQLERQIRENSADLIDTKADDVFYYGQGKAYAYYLLFKALGHDYKNIIVKKDAYGIWTSMLKALENAAQITPAVVRNGKLDSLGAPNHLAALGFYVLKAQTLMNRIVDKINTPAPNKE